MKPSPAVTAVGAKKYFRGIWTTFNGAFLRKEPYASYRVDGGRISLTADTPVYTDSTERCICGCSWSTRVGSHTTRVEDACPDIPGERAARPMHPRQYGATHSSDGGRLTPRWRTGPCGGSATLLCVAWPKVTWRRLSRPEMTFPEGAQVGICAIYTQENRSLSYGG